VPTEKLRAAHRDRWQHVAATLREVRPEAAAAFALDDPEFVAARFVALVAFSAANRCTPRIKSGAGFRRKMF